MPKLKKAPDFQEGDSYLRILNEEETPKERKIPDFREGDSYLQVLNEGALEREDRSLDLLGPAVRSEEFEPPYEPEEYQAEYLNIIENLKSKYPDRISDLNKWAQRGESLPVIQKSLEMPVEPEVEPTAQDEEKFQKWYAERAQRLDLNPNPDDPRHYYDYRAAFLAGAEPDETGHWPSQFKKEGHPNLVIDGIDTRTGEPVREQMPPPPRTVEESWMRQMDEKEAREAAAKEMRATQKLEEVAPGLEKEAEMPPAVRTREAEAAKPIEGMPEGMPVEEVPVRPEEVARRDLEAEYKRIGEELAQMPRPELAGIPETFPLGKAAPPVSTAVRDVLKEPELTSLLSQQAEQLIKKGGFLQQVPRQFIRAVGETGLSIDDLIDMAAEVSPMATPADLERVAIRKQKKAEMRKRLAEFTGDPEGLGGYAGATIGQLAEFIAEMGSGIGALKKIGAVYKITKAVSKIPGTSRFAQVLRYIAQKAATETPVFAAVEAARTEGEADKRIQAGLHGVKMGLVFSALATIPGKVISPGTLARVPLGNYMLGTNPVETGEILADESISTEDKLIRLFDSAVNTWFSRKGFTKQSLTGLHTAITADYLSRGEAPPKPIMDSLEKLLSRAPERAAAEVAPEEIAEERLLARPVEPIEKPAAAPKKAVEKPPLRKLAKEELVEIEQKQKELDEKLIADTDTVAKQREVLSEWFDGLEVGEVARGQGLVANHIGLGFSQGSVEVVVSATSPIDGHPHHIPVSITASERQMLLKADFLDGIGKKKEGFELEKRARQQIIDRITAKVEKPAEAVEKEPWEMTKEEYLDRGKSFRPVSTPAELKEMHKIMVRKALADGKPVPAEVLADYPELAKEKPAEKPEVEITGKGKEKTVEVPKAEGKELTLKEQKEYLNKEIDAAIKAADPAEEDSYYAAGKKLIKWPEFNEENEKKYGTVTIEVPGDGTFTVLNTKPNLEHFKKATRGFPTAKWKPPTFGAKPVKVPTPMGKRMVGVEYYNPFRPRKQKIIFAGKPSEYEVPPQVHAYVDGFYTQGHYAVKIEKPKPPYPFRELDKEFRANFKNVITMPKEVVSAEFVAETFPIEYDIAAEVEKFQPPKIHAVTKEDKHFLYNASYVDVILTEHPNAELFIESSGQAYFKKGKDIVGTVMPLRPTEDVEVTGKLEDMPGVIQRGYAELTGKAVPKEAKPEVEEFTVEQRAIIGTHVAELGSIKKVAEYYPGKGEPDIFARKRADELFGKKKPSEEKAVERELYEYEKEREEKLASIAAKREAEKGETGIEAGLEKPEPKSIDQVAVDKFRAWPEKIKEVGEDYWTEAMATAKTLLTPYKYNALRGKLLGKFERKKEKGLEQVKGIELLDVTDALTATHELGHNIDWLLNNKSFPRSIKLRFPETTAGEKTLRGELKEVSKVLRADLWEAAETNRNTKSYLSRHQELMADYLSHYILDPEAARELSPNITAAFERRLADKPELLDVISRLQRERYTGPERPVIAKRIREAFPLPKKYEPLKLNEELAGEDYVKTAESLGVQTARNYKALIRKADEQAQRIDKLIPDKDRQTDLVVIAEKGKKNPWTGETREEILKRGLNSNEEKAIKLFRAYQEEARQTVNQYLRGAGEAEYIKFIEDYFIHAYSTPMTEKYKTAIHKWAKKSPQAKKRILPDLNTAVEIGLKPRARTLSEGLNLWAGINYRVATNKAFLKILPTIINENGISIIQNPKDFPQWPTVDYWPIRKTYSVPLKNRGRLLFQGRVAVDPRVKKFIDAMFGQRFFNTPVRIIEAFNALTKAFELTLFSFFHHQAEYFSAAGAFGLRRVLPVVGGYWGKRAELFGKKKRFGVLPARVSLLEAGRQLEKTPEFVDDYIKHGGQIGRITTEGIGLMEKMFRDTERYFGNIAHTKPGIGRLAWAPYIPAKGVSKTYSAMQRLLWNNVTRIKLLTYYTLVSEGIEKTKLPVKEVKETVAKYCNDNYGGQEWLNSIFKNPKTRQAFTQNLLSLDWTWSQIKMSTWPFRFGGKTPQEKFKRQLMRKIGLRHWFNYAQTITFFTIAANYALNGYGPWDNEKGHKLDIDYTNLWRDLPWNSGLIGKSWKEEGEYARRYIAIGKAGREIHRWIVAPLLAYGYKSSPLSSLIFEQLTGHTPGSWFAEPWHNENLEAYEKVYLRFKGVMEKFRPFAFGENNAFWAFPVRKGMTHWKAVKCYKEIYNAKAHVAAGGIGAKLTKAFHILDKDEKKLVKDIIEACKLNRVDHKDADSQALSKIRTEFYRRFWRAAIKQNVKDTNRYADALEELGVTLESLLQSAERRKEQLSSEALKLGIKAHAEATLRAGER